MSSLAESTIGQTRWKPRPSLTTHKEPAMQRWTDCVHSNGAHTESITHIMRPRRRGSFNRPVHRTDPLNVLHSMKALDLVQQQWPTLCQRFIGRWSLIVELKVVKKLSSETQKITNTRLAVSNSRYCPIDNVVFPLNNCPTVYVSLRSSNENFESGCLIEFLSLWRSSSISAKRVLCGRQNCSANFALQTQISILSKVCRSPCLRQLTDAKACKSILLLLHKSVASRLLDLPSHEFFFQELFSSKKRLSRFFDWGQHHRRCVRILDPESNALKMDVIWTLFSIQRILWILFYWSINESIRTVKGRVDSRIADWKPKCVQKSRLAKFSWPSNNLRSGSRTGTIDFFGSANGSR